MIKNVVVSTSGRQGKAHGHTHGWPPSLSFADRLPQAMPNLLMALPESGGAKPGATLLGPAARHQARGVCRSRAESRSAPGPPSCTRGSRSAPRSPDPSSRTVARSPAPGAPLPSLRPARRSLPSSRRPRRPLSAALPARGALGERRPPVRARDARCSRGRLVLRVACYSIVSL